MLGDRKDHPRIRGESEKITVRACAGKYEHQHIVLDAVDQEPVGGDVAGSPPHTRGKGATYFKATWPRRITPAYAGKRLKKGLYSVIVI